MGQDLSQKVFNFYFPQTFDAESVIPKWLRLKLAFQMIFPAMLTWICLEPEALQEN